MCTKMAIFLSTFVNTVDNKGRVVVPKEFRVALGNVADNFHGFVAFRSHKFGAIDCFSMDRMEKLSTQIDQTMDPFSIDRDSIESAVFADAVIMRFDKDGRVVIPQSLLEHARIGVSAANGACEKGEAKVAFVGRGATFQLWNPDDFHIHQMDARAKLMKRAI